MTDSAAFFRLEGVLFSVDPAAVAAWLALRDAQPADRLKGIGRVFLGALTSSTLGGLGADARTLSEWSFTDGWTSDRWLTLCEDWVHAHRKAKILAAGHDLLHRAVSHGDRVVVISSLPRTLAEALLEGLPVDELVADAIATDDRGLLKGELTGDGLRGRIDGTWLQRYARAHHLNPALSAGYGHSGGDVPMLSAVGRPCAVSPTLSLRRQAHQFRWPVVEARP